MKKGEGSSPAQKRGNSNISADVKIAILKVKLDLKRLISIANDAISELNKID